MVEESKAQNHTKASTKLPVGEARVKSYALSFRVPQSIQVQEYEATRKGLAPRIPVEREA